MFTSINCCLGAIAQLQSAEDIRDMVFDCSLTDDQLLGYLPIGSPLCNQV